MTAANGNDKRDHPEVELIEDLDRGLPDDSLVIDLVDDDSGVAAEPEQSSEKTIRRITKNMLSVEFLRNGNNGEMAPGVGVQL